MELVGEVLEFKVSALVGSSDLNGQGSSVPGEEWCGHRHSALSKRTECQIMSSLKCLGFAADEGSARTTK